MRSVLYFPTGMKTILFFHTSTRESWRKEIAGAYRFARGKGWRVQIIEPTKRPPSVPNLIRFWNPLGCLVECSGTPAGFFDHTMFAAIPTVFIGRDPRTLPATASFVNPDNRGPGMCAAKELLTADFTSFGFVATSGNHFWSRDREAEFRRTLWANGYSCAVFGRKERFKGDKARKAALGKWLKALPKPCGILAENDYAATEVLDLANQFRIKCPNHLAVIGVDNDSSLCENSKPALSSVFLDFEQAGYRASEILSTLIEKPNARPIRETYSALGLFRRGSTPAGSGTSPRIGKVLAYIREKACDGITVADIARQMPGSRRLAEMDFRKATGKSMLEELLDVRFERVELLLRNKSQQLGAIAGLCGWKSENALRSLFLRRYGKSMRAWRAAHTQQIA